jgi:predicted ATPase/DNA-binding SARP family transcriptional activator
MEFRLLGRLAVEADGLELLSSRPRERAVLALLLLRRGRVASIEGLIDALWGGDPPPTARTALHGHVSALRKRLGAERIETKQPGYRLRLLPGDTLDVERFEAILADASAEGPAVRSEMLREALELFRGEVLEDLDRTLDPSADLALELASERARLEGLRLVAEERRAAADLALGRHLATVPRLEALVALHPLREGLRAQLMLALYRAGRQADALRTAQDGRQILTSDLGVEPGPVLQRLELLILNHDPELSGAPEAAAAGSLPTGVVTFLATDASEGIEELSSRYGGVRTATARRGVAMAFSRARDGAAAAAAIQRAARRDEYVPRIGIHSAAVDPIQGRYPAPDVDQAWRLADVAHPGQVVLSRASRDLLREAPLEEADVRDLGPHRLRDLGPSQPLFQLVAGGLAVDFPPVRGLDARPTNLPVQPTALIGRERELEAVTDLLREPGTRLVTLTGPGGTGKTRLAVHAAVELLDDAPDGVFFVALDALAQPELVGPAIATAAGIRAWGGESPVAVLIRELRNRRILLVLDNCEHLLAAAPIIGEILAAVPGVTVLATSRTRLRIEGERVFAVPTLAAPEADGAPIDLANLQGIDAVALFTARARAASPEFSLTSENASAVADLCRALEGLPLAIELAASRMGILPPTVLVDRLDQALRMLTGTRRPGPERHRALQVTIDWSHDLLEPDARRLFAAVAVFAGGWTLDAAESVAGDGLDVIDGLANLVDQSLIRLQGTETDPRFGMLETIHEYARDKLEASGLRANTERRHAAFFLSLAQAAEPYLRGNPGSWVSRLQVEQDNIRAALDRLAVLGDGEAEARLAGHLWRFWYLGGHLAEGRRRLEHALEVHADPTPARARALIGAAVMAVNTRDLAVARERAAEGLALHRSMGDAWGAAYCLYMLGAVARGEGDYEMARTVQVEALSAFRALGDDHSALLVSRNLAGALEDLGDLDGARLLYQDNLRRARLDHNGRLEASSLGALATLAFDDGRVADALWMLRESLRLHRELADRLDTAVDLARAAQTLSMVGRPLEAARVVAALSAVRDELGVRGREVIVMTDDALSRARRQLAEPETARALEEGSGLRLDDALDLALDALGAERVGESERPSG